MGQEVFSILSEDGGGFVPWVETPCAPGCCPGQSPLCCPHHPSGCVWISMPWPLTNQCAATRQIGVFFFFFVFCRGFVGLVFLICFFFNPLPVLEGASSLWQAKPTAGRRRKALRGERGSPRHPIVCPGGATATWASAVRPARGPAEGTQRSGLQGERLPPADAQCWASTKLAALPSPAFRGPFRGTKRARGCEPPSCAVLGRLVSAPPLGGGSLCHCGGQRGGSLGQDAVYWV